MAVEATGLSSFETVVSRFAMGVVGDDAVVSVLLRIMRDNDRSCVCHAVANLLHGSILLPLHSIHTPLGLIGDGDVACLVHSCLGALAGCLSSLSGGLRLVHLSLNFTS
mgnify:FL=1